MASGVNVSLRQGFAVVLGAALLLTGCNQSKKRAIAVIPKGQTHLFWQSVHAGAESAARENNVEIIWNGPAVETDYTGQMKIVDSMISRRVDAIVLAPIDRKAMVGGVERAGKEGIPVVIFDSGVDTEQIVAQVATDNYQAGQIAAKRMCDILAGKGKVAMVKVQVGGASTEARESGFEDALAKECPAVQIVQKLYGQSDYSTSRRVAENMLAAHPDLDGMFGSNESSAVGAALALKARSSKVKLIGFDWSPALKDDLNAGVIDSLVVQHPFKMGHDAVASAVAKLEGKPVEKKQDLAPRLVQKADLDNPEVQAQLNPDLKKYLN